MKEYSKYGGFEILDKFRREVEKERGNIGETRVIRAVDWAYTTWQIKGEFLERNYEVFELNDGREVKKAYGKFYEREAEVLEIELEHILYYESKIGYLFGILGLYSDEVGRVLRGKKEEIDIDYYVGELRKILDSWDVDGGIERAVALSGGGMGGRGKGRGGRGGMGRFSLYGVNLYEVYLRWREALKGHYRNCVFLLSSEIAYGWHRWNEYILDLFISPEINKVLWGSGNCAKSKTYACLLYIKWRANPSERMIVIASRVMKDSGARVFGYIQDLHLNAPRSTAHKFLSVNTENGKDNKGIYYGVFDKNTKRFVHSPLGCIVSLPIRVDAKNDEYGSNLLGKHPKDKLVIALDEAQDIPGKMAESKIFANWLTNSTVEVHCWGNPVPVMLDVESEWDLLFRLGVGGGGGGKRGLGKEGILGLSRKAKKTFIVNTTPITKVLHLTMLDSPKDDEVNLASFVGGSGGDGDGVGGGGGAKKHRLYFLAGADTIRNIQNSGISEGSPTWYSQVLGFAYMDDAMEGVPSVVTPSMVRESKKGVGSGVGSGVGGLEWITSDGEMKWYMGLDPSITGRGDKCVITVCKVGIMGDGRWGVDFMGGRHNKVLEAGSGAEEASGGGWDEFNFVDYTVDVLYQMSRRYKVPLNRIAVETHGSGEVYRYALEKKIGSADGWIEESRLGLKYVNIAPYSTVSDRLLFISLGEQKRTCDFIADYNTELYYAVRCGIMLKQFHNISEDAVLQLYNRYLFAPTRGTKYRLETKKEMKVRGVSGSPDFADSLAYVVEAVRLGGGFKFMPYKIAGAEAQKKAALRVGEQRRHVAKCLGRVSNLLGLQENLALHLDVGGDSRERLGVVKREALRERYRRGGGIGRGSVWGSGI